MRLIDAEEIEELFHKQVEYGATDLVAAFDDALQDARTVYVADVMRGMWISVKDRKPDRTMPPHDVLVYHDLNCGMFIDRAWYSHEKNKWRSAVGMNLKVTHWMPLPEPPEEDKP